jgi:hypothetical protein
MSGDKPKFKFRKPKDFLYNRKGPWPQPCPAHPFGESPAVLHLPWQETLDWWRHIGLRYAFTLPYSVCAYGYGVLNPGLKEVKDEEFNHMLSETMLCRFIKQDYDEKDREIFGDLLDDKDNYLVDLGAMKVVKTFKGIYASGSKTLIKHLGDYKYETLKIYIDKTDSMFEPTDGDHWELAKYFVLQGGAICATLVVHPLLHFPMDSINAITKTALPKDHILFRILYPHLRFTLYLENAVLTFKSSLLQMKWWMPYAPYPGPYDGIRELLVEGFKGMDENASYPEYKYTGKPQKIHSHYGTLLEKYFEVIHKYIIEMMTYMKDDEEFYLLKWFDYVSGSVPGFPNGAQVKNDKELRDRTIAFYLYDITVSHSIDHYSYGNMDLRKIPQRLRAEPPKTGTTFKLDRSKLTKFWDYGKYRMANKLFFAPTTVTSLIKTRYDFGARSSKLDPITREFKVELRELDKELKEKGMQYIPLDWIAASIQY